MAPRTIKKILREYKQNIANQLPLTGMYVFGSFAKGTMRPDSDVDIIVVSKAFEKINGLERSVILSELRNGSAESIPMDLIGLTPKELRDLRKYKDNVCIVDMLKNMKTV